MAAWIRLITAVVIMGSITAGFEDSPQRMRRDDSDEVGHRPAGQLTYLCPCTQGCCDTDWFHYKDACYQPMRDQATWDQAKRRCNALDGHLASVHSEEENNFIFHLMNKSRNYWLGAERTHGVTANPWMWLDDTPWDFSNFTNQREQLSSNSLAVQSTDRGNIYWKSLSRDASLRFVCKYLLS
uniref:Snaclec agkisacutacin subunit B-like n=1 Tax=Pogona vitticeps TaxID=103695 RepID=A0A6J0V0P1_9SAUR